MFFFVPLVFSFGKYKRDSVRICTESLLYRILYRILYAFVQNPSCIFCTHLYRIPLVFSVRKWILYAPQDLTNSQTTSARPDSTFKISLIFIYSKFSISLIRCYLNNLLRYLITIIMCPQLSAFSFLPQWNWWRESILLTFGLPV